MDTRMDTYPGMVGIECERGMSLASKPGLYHGDGIHVPKCSLNWPRASSRLQAEGISGSVSNFFRNRFEAASKPMIGIGV